MLNLVNVTRFQKCFDHCSCRFGLGLGLQLSYITKCLHAWNMCHVFLLYLNPFVLHLNVLTESGGTKP